MSRMDKFYVFCKNYSRWINLAFLLLIIAMLLSPNIATLPHELSFQPQHFSKHSGGLIQDIIRINKSMGTVPTDPGYRWDFFISNLLRTEVYPITLLLFLGLLSIIIFIKHNKITIIPSIAYLALSIYNIAYCLVLKKDVIPSVGFYIALFLIIAIIGYRLFTSYHREKYIANNGNDYTPKNKPRKPTQRERIDALQREIDELKKRDV